ncbi:MAG: hypothetical protein V2J89_01700 [Halieaceae bacterium]|nr:hypothetical protein [Halieaceae bacterium]
MFTNKHVVTALIVAPILSVLAWFAVGNLIGEAPAPAQAGNAYPLVEKSNCRWASGRCDLENADFRVTLRYSGKGALELRSEFPLQAATFSVHDPASDIELPPMALEAEDESGLRWQLLAAGMPSPGQRIRLVASADGSRYYGEAGTAFAQPPDKNIPGQTP